MAVKKKNPAQSVRKIEHVIVLMLENRSFDHIFGFHPGVNGLKGNELNLLDPTKPESTGNPSFVVNNGAPWAVLAGKGPGHSLSGTNYQLANDKNGPSAQNPAKNNGFARNYSNELSIADKVPNPTNADIEVVMQGFAPARLPSINALADAFVLCDNWYSEVPGPTQPNRLFMHAATSRGFVHNVWKQQFDNPTIYNSLQDAGFTWATYEHDYNEVREFTQINTQNQNFKKFIESFAADVKADALANYSFIVPREVNSPEEMANDQHAPQDVRYGDNFIADVYNALRANDAVWQKSVLIVTYDEHGGFYDHVIPPATVNPDGISSPIPNSPPWVPAFDFTRLGLRVPAIIASPWVQAGYVDHTQYQHTSVLATVRNMFGLAKPLTKRDAGARPFDGLFSLDTPRNDTPQTLPRAPLPAITASKDAPEHPANAPLDPTQHDLVMNAWNITEPSHPKGPGLDNLPHRQGDASKFMQDRYLKHFGPHGKPGKRPPLKTKKKK